MNKSHEIQTSRINFTPVSKLITGWGDIFWFDLPRPSVLRQLNIPSITWW